MRYIDIGLVLIADAYYYSEHDMIHAGFRPGFEASEYARVKFIV